LSVIAVCYTLANHSWCQILVLSNNIEKGAISVRETANPFSEHKNEVENAISMELSTVCVRIQVSTCNGRSVFIYATMKQVLTNLLALFIFQALAWIRDTIQNVHIFNVITL